MCVFGFMIPTISLVWYYMFIIYLNIDIISGGAFLLPIRRDRMEPWANISPMDNVDNDNIMS